MRKLGLILTASLALVAGPHRTQDAASDDAPAHRARLVVRLKAPLAEGASAALDGPRGAVSRRTAPPAVASFLDAHGVASLSPVHGGRALARARQGLSDAALAARVQRRFAARARRHRGAFAPPELSRSFVVERGIGSRRELQALMAALARDPRVERVEEDKLVRLDLVTDDPYLSTAGSWGQAYDDLYGLKKIQAPAAWDLTAGEGVTVAVVDTGIDRAHPDLAANVWSNPGETPGNAIDDDGNGYVDDAWGWDFVGARAAQPVPDADPSDGHGHGTHVAGTIAAVGNNGRGVVGVAWQAKVMGLKGLDDFGSGYDSQLAAAIVYAADNGADVINASFGGRGTSLALQDAVDYATSLGVVFVAAAGNSSADASGFYPAGFHNAITVAASDASDKLASFSNWGGKIDVAAPGVDVLSLRAAGTNLGPVVGTEYCRLSGTSMAAPHVSGLAALVIAGHPGYSTEQVRQAIRASADEAGAAGFDQDFGYGRVNAAAAAALDGALEARIQSPAPYARLDAATSVTGLVRGAGLARYELAVGAGETPAEWTLLQEGAGPVAGSELGVLDASGMPDGVHTLRLLVFDAVGRAFVDRRAVVVDRVAISSPLPPPIPTMAAVVKPGSTVAVEGRADGGSFVRFRVEWAHGVNPASGWSAQGISLVGDGLAPVTEGPLASWDTSGPVITGYRTLRLLVENAGYTSEARSLVYFEPDLLSSHWPRLMEQPPWPEVAVLPARGAAGEPTLVVADAPMSSGNARLWRFSADGSSVRTSDLSYTGPFQAAVADLGGMPGEEVITGGSWSLFVVQPNDTVLYYAARAPAGFSRGIPVVQDLDGGGPPELLGVGTDFTNGLGYVEAWRADGSHPQGAFPVTIPDKNLSLSMSGEPRLLVADFDGDGAREIVVATGPGPSSVELRMLAADGSPRPFAAPVYQGSFVRLAAGDLDRDGILEILVVMSDQSDWTNQIHVLTPGGVEKPGWPATLPMSGGDSQVALGDLDRDGRNEVVVASSGKLHVLGANGQSVSPAWPRSLGSYGIGGLAIADVTGDGVPEILASTADYYEIAGPLFPLGASQVAARAAASGAPPARQARSDGLTAAAEPPVGALERGWIGYYSHRLVALRLDGATLKSWQLHGAGGQELAFLATPIVTDVDGDGKTDIAVISNSAPLDESFVKSGVVTVLTTGSPYRAGANDWPLLRHDAGNTAVLSRDRTAPSVSLTAPLPGATITEPTLVKASATDDVFVRGVQFRLDGANLGPEDTTAPFQANLDPRVVGNGPHVLSAVARDAAGNLAESAPLPITVDVDITPPTAAITSPAPGATLSGPITVAADAQDQGTIARVELHVDGILVATDTTAPYQLAWNAGAATDGSHTLVAKAWDAAGNVGASAPVAVTVAVAPTTSITSPVPGASLTGVVGVTAVASDNVAVQRVELYVDDVRVATDLTAPYSFVWDTRLLADGPRTLTTRAFDAASNVGTSTPVAVTTGNPPTVAITAPAIGTVVQGTVAVTANASDPGGVARVEFLVDDVVVATDLVAPWDFDWDPSGLTEGTHMVKARAWDFAGNQATVGRAYTVAWPPSVAITAPAPGSVLTGSVPVSVDATDNVRVARVDVLVDGVIAVVKTEAPWVFTLESFAYPDGPHVLSAKAYDNLSASTSSAPLPVSTANDVAAYDTVLKAPVCGAVGRACDTGTLVRGRGSVGPEPNRPNTLYAGCNDGSAGGYHSDESNDRIRVQTLDGSNLAAGKTVRVEATVWAYLGYSSDKLDLYHAPDARSPVWTLLGTFTPPGSGGRTIATTFTLPPGALQAVRARFRYNGSAAPCGTGAYDDHDDLAFAVETPADVDGPTVSISSPAVNETVSGDVTVTATAADASGVARVEFLVDGVVRSIDTTAPYSFVWASASESPGTHTLAARAADVLGNVRQSAAVPVVVTTPGIAYDPVLRAPRCSAATSSCDSGTFLVGRGTKGPEPNAPNTINGSCADGTAGSFHSDESVDRVSVSTLDGTNLGAGKTVRVEAAVWAYASYTSDKLDLYHAPDGSNPVWTLITTLTPPGSGAQTMSTTFVLPSGSLQAVRARFRWGGNASPCGTGSYDDHDDLLFRVE